MRNSLGRTGRCNSLCFWRLVIELAELSSKLSGGRRKDKYLECQQERGVAATLGKSSLK